MSVKCMVTSCRLAVLNDQVHREYLLRLWLNVVCSWKSFGWAGCRLKTAVYWHSHNRQLRFVKGAMTETEFGVLDGCSLLLREQSLNALCLPHDMNVESEKVTPPFSIFYGLWCNTGVSSCAENDDYHLWHMYSRVNMYLAHKWKKSGCDSGLKGRIAKCTFSGKVSFVQNSLKICLERITFSCHANSGGLRDLYLITFGENIPFCVSS